MLDEHIIQTERQIDTLKRLRLGLKWRRRLLTRHVPADGEAFCSCLQERGRLARRQPTWPPNGRSR
jgi:hypothetical protein